jgi:ATP-dependent DNA helicase RecG
MEQTTGRTWDALPCPGLSMRDIDRGAVVDLLRRAGLDTSMDTRHVLHNLAMLTAEGELVNGSALLFAADPQRLLPEALTRCARFVGTTSVGFIDQATYEGTLVAQLEAALKFVARNTHQAIHITGKPAHDVVSEYPLEAVREALVNAICHRSYTDPGTVQVRIYDDRLEVWNPGMLPHGLTIDQLYREHGSHPRNPRIAQALRRGGLVEQWGGGTLRIISACEAHGLGLPEFVTEAGMFRVRFVAAVGATPVREAELTDRQQRVLAFVREYGSVATTQLAGLLDVGKSQAKQVLQELVELGLLARTGQGRATRYVPAN